MKVFDVFISYHRKDLEFVRKLFTQLEGQGIKCWVDFNNIQRGTFFIPQITTEIKKLVEEAKVFLVIISNDIPDGSFMEKEVSLACDYGAKFILPVYLNKAQAPNTLRYLLSPFNSIHIEKEQDLTTLIETIQSLLDKNVWVFVSHSNKDFDKIIKLRNQLENRHYRPLLFFLKCLEDDEEIFELIKREINARDRFLLCKSKNTQISKWVQKEIDYIQSLGRPYEIIDLEADDTEIQKAINRFDRRSTVYIWSTETKFNQLVALELIKRSFRVSFLPMDYYEKHSSGQHITDGYVLILISRKLTKQESDAISLSAKTICEYTYPIVLTKEAFENYDLYRELQNLDGIQTRSYLLNSDENNEAVQSFKSDEERAIAVVNHFIEIDSIVNNLK